ncbi:MAG TPA: cellulose synthase family protein [Phycisphaerae bacterium]
MMAFSLQSIPIYLYGTVLVLVCIYGLHRYQLVYLYYKHRRNRPELLACFRELPRVTIQLPMYNERYVARRVIEAAAAIEYPRDRLQIQVLDDSTDDTVQIAADTVARLRAAGIDIVHLHRTDRTGYKAGALEAGLASATGELVSIFDADFIPPARMLYETIHYFTDPQVGMVQARWEHLNRDLSLLTKTQAVLLDGHFVIEHGARNRSGRFMSFNGTAGIWRKSCIADAGSWQHDTLTEDLDLSYRAQLRGWRFIFLPELASPAELPPEIEAFKAQQHRWAKGGAQTCRKLLVRVMRSQLPWRVKLEAFFHLTSCLVHLLIVLLMLLLYPVLYIKLAWANAAVPGGWMIDASLFLVATCSASCFYACSQRELFRTWSDSLKYLPFLMSLGVGVSINNGLAVLDGLFGGASEFVRTPKFGVATSSDQEWKKRTVYRRKLRSSILPFLELGMGVFMFGCLLLCVQAGDIGIGAPFMAMFTIGYWYVGGSTLMLRYAAHKAESAASTAIQTPPPQSATLSRNAEEVTFREPESLTFSRNAEGVR